MLRRPARVYGLGLPLMSVDPALLSVPVPLPS